jgi:putative acetyltransferase
MDRPEIRGESTSDVADIREVHLAAFPTRGEADLVDQLRRGGSAMYSLVAVLDERLVGHVMLSRMQSPELSLGLAPVAVLEAHRGRGIAARLIAEALSQAKSDGWKSVFVLGGAYYKRFGFDPNLAAKFSSPYAGPHFMALELQEGALAAQAGTARYAQAFEDLDG